MHLFIYLIYRASSDQADGLVQSDQTMGDSILGALNMDTGIAILRSFQQYFSHVMDERRMIRLCIMEASKRFT